MPSVSSTRYSPSREPTQDSPMIQRSVFGQSSDAISPSHDLPLTGPAWSLAVSFDPASILRGRPAPGIVPPAALDYTRLTTRSRGVRQSDIHDDATKRTGVA